MCRQVKKNYPCSYILYFKKNLHRQFNIKLIAICCYSILLSFKLFIAEDNKLCFYATSSNKKENKIQLINTKEMLLKTIEQWKVIYIKKVFYKEP